MSSLSMGMCSDSGNLTQGWLTGRDGGPPGSNPEPFVRQGKHPNYPAGLSSSLISLVQDIRFVDFWVLNQHFGTSHLHLVQSVNYLGVCSNTSCVDPLPNADSILTHINQYVQLKYFKSNRPCELRNHLHILIALGCADI